MLPADLETGAAPIVMPEKTRCLIDARCVATAFGPLILKSAPRFNM